MPIRPDDRITVAGLPGVHTVLEAADVLYPSHRSYLIRLGMAVGRHLIGDTIAVEGWRCSKVRAEVGEKRLA